MEQKLRDAIKLLMKEKQVHNTEEVAMKLQTQKNILETAQKMAKDKKSNVTDSLIVEAAKKEMKQLNDLKEYCKDKPDKLQMIEIGLTVAGTWLPEMISAEQIKQFVISVNPKGVTIGSVMKQLREKYGDALDAKLASQIIKETLSK